MSSSSSWASNRSSSSSTASSSKACRVPVLSWDRQQAMVMRIFSRGLLTARGGWGPGLLMLSSVGAEALASRVGFVIADFYGAISSDDGDRFLRILWGALLLVTAIAIMKALQSFSAEMCALQWRCSMVDFIHERYFKGTNAYCLLKGIQQQRQPKCPNVTSSSSLPQQQRDRLSAAHHHDDKELVDNPDQRVTRDVELLCSNYAEALSKILVIPGLVVYYTAYLWIHFNWKLPAVCFLFFTLGAGLTSWFLRRIIDFVYAQERFEGHFRFDHMWFRVNIEPISLYKGAATERKRLVHSFNNVIRNKRQLICRRFPLSLSTNLIDYLGSIVNYAAVGISILWMSNMASDLSESEMAALVANGTFNCIQLVSAFSSCMDVSQQVSDIAGYTARVVELMVALGATTADAGAISMRDPVPDPEAANRCCPFSPREAQAASSEGRPRGMLDFAPRTDVSVPYIALDEAIAVPLIHSVDDDYPPATNVSDLEAALPAVIVPQRSTGFYVRNGNDDGGGGEGVNEITRELSRSLNVEAGGEGVAEVLLKLQGVSVRAPPPVTGRTASTRQQLLVENLTLTVLRRQNVLIVGPSGCGKTSLVRAIAGLWPLSSGTVVINSLTKSSCISDDNGQSRSEGGGAVAEQNVRHPQPTFTEACAMTDATWLVPSKVMYLPQCAYCFRGSLFEHIVYPLSPRSARIRRVGDLSSLSSCSFVRRDHCRCASCEDTSVVAELDTLLENLSLGHLMGYVDQCWHKELDWAGLLSPGEQQRLAVARLLFHAPELAVMDESTAAVDVAMEDCIYSLCRHRGITLVSIGHRTTLERHHKRKLTISGGGRWEMSTI